MPSADIFCRVIDNFGDIGVCWRLARQLHQQYGYRVRLWVDELASFGRICPALQPELAEQDCDGVWIGHWLPDWQASAAGDLVIEAFACELPALMVDLMRESGRSVWLNLDYLSAEDWVLGCHGLPSPQQGLNKWFFFPGFVAGTGGLLREAGLAAQQQAWNRQQFWTQLGLLPPEPDTLSIALFCYENAGLEAWLKVLTQTQPIRLLVPQGRISRQIEVWLGEPWRGPLTRGALTLVPLPMTDQAGFDRLLWACDLNLVRGEESLVRAIWAERPFCWHLYRQEDAAHWPKLEAFLAQYLAEMPASLAEPVAEFWRAWNREQGIADAWPAFQQCLEQQADYNRRWSERVQSVGDLAGNLVKFHRARV